ncbi:hypothetical protein AVEN_212785-1 [Araneus ventricosus]|uniref:Uncharacterized protein n=1 Tax=Araneus ventricosus TaxID=182803 RepID=A0A4Y2V4G0_ARAVE|nr:hypothetical protein AVEN_212785-1 [Araneus ventricosus]
MNQVMQFSRSRKKFPGNFDFALNVSRTPPSFVQNTAEASSPNTPPEANSERREIQNLCELTRSSQMNTAEASSPNTPPEANSECREMPEFM